MVKVAINGFERVGRVAFRAAVTRYADQVEMVAINAFGSRDVLGLGHLLKHDTIYGKFPAEIDIEPKGGKEGEIGAFLIEGKRYPVLAIKETASIPWNQYGVEVVLETNRAFRNSVDCQGHLQSGAGKVVIAAATGDPGIPTYVLNVNTQGYHGERIISNASCTTNCIAPVAQIMKDNFQIKNAYMTTIHAYTADQEVVDSSHTDLRRARAAALNIVPTTTGAAGALGAVLPGFIGHFSGMAIRVPVPCGSLADFTFHLLEEVDIDQVNHVFEQAAGGSYRGTLAVTREPIVSSDIIGESTSALVDLSLTEVVGKNLVKIVVWYDNEWSYACRLLEMASLVADKT